MSSSRNRKGERDWDKKPKNASLDRKVVEAIARRRRQMLIHCYIYYVMDQNVVDDHTWQKWADQLAKLQRKYGHRIGFYDKTFSDWDGSTGYHLPRDPEIGRVAERVLRIHNEIQDILT